MKKLPEVESAKALMTEAMTWSVMKWLREKKRVRRVADQANAALDQLNESVKASWSKDLRAAYKALVTLDQERSAASKKEKQPPQTIDPEAKLITKKVKEADDNAYRARIEAEKSFDEAETLLSTSLAREGCKKAIHSWDLHEKAIREAEAAIRSNCR